MPWSHHRNDTPTFIWDNDSLLRAEWLFLSETGLVSGMAGHLSNPGQSEFMVRLLRDDIVANIEIDGESLHPEGVACCIRRRLGLSFAQNCGTRAEMIAAEMAVAISANYNEPFSQGRLERWRTAFLERGEGALFRFAPNHSGVLKTEQREELERFKHWYNNLPLDFAESPLLSAALAHLWFESIYPAPEGTGILGRIVAEKLILRHSPGHVFIPLCLVFHRYRNEYHRILDWACRDRDATGWIRWFAAKVIEAVRLQRALMEFAVARERVLGGELGVLSGDERVVLDSLFDRGLTCPGIGAREFSRLLSLPMAGTKRVLGGLVSRGMIVRGARGNAIRYHLQTPQLPKTIKPEDIA